MKTKANILAGKIAGLNAGKMFQIVTLLKQFTDYVARVLADSGLIKDRSATSRYMQMAKSNGMLDSIRFAWLGEAAYKHRTSGINTFWTKLYSLIGTNDATQTTSTDQPYLSGNIAPNEKWCLKNPNGGDEYMTHPTISFAANEAWSVTTVFNNFGAEGLQGLFGSSTNYTSGVSIDRQILYIDSQSGILEATDIPLIIGKTTIMTLIASGNDTIDVNIDGVFISTISGQFDFNFERLFIGHWVGYRFIGNLFAHIIRAQALTPTQVAAEANFLRSLYPEIPSVTIGSQVWATSNCEQVASSNGTLIADGNVQATWASYAAAYWCHHTDIATGSVFGKLYNKKGRDVLIANPPSGWHVATKAELTALAANGGNALKKDGTIYWTTTGGTNITGFTAIGGASRNADGTFNAIKNTATFWCADSDEVLLLNHNDNTATIVATTSAQGHSIRLVKD